LKSPFNERKYKKLLEGLEVSEVKLSEVSRGIFRFDSEPFQKINNIKLGRFQTKKLSEIVITNPQKSEISNLDKNLKISFIPMALLGNGIIDSYEEGKISDFIKSGYTYFAENDILIAKITPCMEHGKCAIANNLINGIGFGSTEYNVFRVTDKSILKEYLFTFLNREIIRKQATNNMIGTSGRQRVPIVFYENLFIPILPMDFQIEIRKCFEKANKNRVLSQQIYHQAEDLLLETIGLKKFKPSTKTTNIKSFKESFLKTGRLDAEYYQPKYEKIENLIKSLNYAKVKDLVSFINHGKQPPYIENGTIRVFSQKWIGDKSIDYSFLNATEEPYTSKEFANQNNDYVAGKNDILYYSVGANLGYCHNYLIDEPIMPGSFITLIRANSKKINPIYLGVALNSMLGRMQAEKRKSASAQPYIYPKDISEFVIPLIDIKIQKQIAALILESFKLRKESERLLEEAKGMVEREIEV